MKKTLLCLVLTLGPVGMLPAVEIVSETVSERPPSAYDQAVQSYVQAATEQMAAIRTQVDTEVGQAPQDAGKQRFAPVYRQLDECDRLLVELKKAQPADFDRIKAHFEETRAVALKAIDAARKN
jgi:hypothetical protein